MSSGDGGFSFPSHRRRGMGALPTPITTTPWMENALTTQALLMVPPQMAAPRPDNDLPFEKHHTHQGGTKCRPAFDGPPLSKMQLHNEASSSASNALP
jgi:hypothetical protein